MIIIEILGWLSLGTIGMWMIDWALCGDKNKPIDKEGWVLIFMLSIGGPFVFMGGILGLLGVIVYGLGEWSRNRKCPNEWEERGRENE